MKETRHIPELTASGKQPSNKVVSSPTMLYAQTSRSVMSTVLGEHHRKPQSHRMHQVDDINVERCYCVKSATRMVFSIALKDFSEPFINIQGYQRK